MGKITNLKNWLLSGARKAPPTLIVLHSTAGWSAASSISWLRQIGFSYSVIFERDGTGTKCVPLARYPYHAGNSYGPREKAKAVSRKQNSLKKFVAGCTVNDYSFGLAFANMEGKNEEITSAQIVAMKEYVAELKKSYPSLKYIMTHREASPGRKTDPAMLRRRDFEAIVKAGGLEIWTYTT